MSFHIISGSERVFEGKLALFDVDGTLVVSKSGRRWAVDEDDWIWSAGSVLATLDEFYQHGWFIALVSNQSEWKLSDKAQKKIESILGAIEKTNGWRPWCAVATATVKEKDTVYRKPGRGLFDKLLENMKVSEKDILSLQMYGDASGEKDKNPAYRWSDSDRAFAKAIGATYLRPFEIFPRHIVCIGSGKEIILLMGNPGSGKSTTAKGLLKLGGEKYVHLEQDVLGTKEKVLKEAKDALDRGASVIVDATHGSLKNREPYLELAREKKIRIRILWHLRDGRPFNALREKPIPEVAYGVYSKHFVEPIAGEGVVVEYI